MFTLATWHLVVFLLALAAAAGAATYAARKRARAGTAEEQAARRAERRAIEVARLTPPGGEAIGSGAAAAMPDERLEARARDLVVQVRLLASEWAGESGHAPPALAPEAGLSERRGAERMLQAQRDHARALYNRIRHETVAVRNAIVTRIDDAARQSRHPGIDRAYEHPAGDEPFQAIADDLELLADALGRGRLHS